MSVVVAILTGYPMVSEMSAISVASSPSVTVTVTVRLPAEVGVPEMVPSVEMVRPSGRPVALQL